MSNIQNATRARCRRCRAGVGLVSGWCRAGVGLVSGWCRAGVGLVSGWCRAGVGLVSGWCRAGVARFGVDGKHATRLNTIIDATKIDYIIG